MSAPDKSMEVQKRRHFGPLIGMALAVIFVVSMMALWLADEMGTADGQQASDPETAVQPGTPVQ